MISKEIADIIDDWLDRLVNNILTYCDRNFWYYRNIAKNYSEQFECTKEQLEFFEKKHIDYKVDLYYLKLAELGNYHFKMTSFYYFREQCELYDFDFDVFSYYNELCLCC